MTFITAYITGSRRTPKSDGTLLRWKSHLAVQEANTRGLGEHLGREGVYVVHRAQGAQAIVSFKQRHRLSVTRASPRVGRYVPHSGDKGTLEETQELNRTDLAKTVTREKDLLLPATMSRETAPSTVANSTRATMTKAVLESLFDAEMFTNKRINRRASSEPEW